MQLVIGLYSQKEILNVQNRGRENVPRIYLYANVTFASIVKMFCNYLTGGNLKTIKTMNGGGNG